MEWKGEEVNGWKREKGNGRIRVGQGGKMQEGGVNDEGEKEKEEEIDSEEVQPREDRKCWKVEKGNIYMTIVSAWSTERIK